MNPVAEWRSRRRRYERVDFCLSRGGWWTWSDLHSATGLWSKIYVRLAQLERAGTVVSEKGPHGVRRWCRRPDEPSKEGAS